ncbi:phage tail tape measure protein [Streptococcus suis]|nr:phage tail tape measure protein [Streptococcus suis]
MAETFEGLFVKFGANTVEFDRSVKGINGALATLKKDVGNINRELRLNPDNIDLLNRKLENFQEQARLGALKVQELRKQQEALGEAEIGSAEWTKLQVQIEQVETQMKSVDRAMEATKQQIDDVGNSNSIYNLNKQLNDVGDELDIVNQKLDLDPGNIDLVEQKMSLLAKQSQLASEKVQQLKQKQQALGNDKLGTDEWKRLQREIGQAEVEVLKIDRAMDELSNSSQIAAGGVRDAASFLQADMMMDVADKASQAGQAMLDFGNEAMQTAAKLKASDAQFSTVFGDMEAQAKSALDNIGKELNIVPERLQGSFTQMAGFAKTTGMDTASALQLTERATRAAADGAAFYDKSIEDVTENLQSFLKGNYENDAALGISATETTRNAKANELYGKSFNELSESQKQLTLLQMVEDGQKAAGALGQAARESDGLENTLGNLQASTDNAMASLGNPILQQLTPIFQALTGIIQAAAEWFSTLNPHIQQTVAVFGMVTAGVLLLIGAITPAIIAFTLLAIPIGTLTSVIGGAIAIISALVLIITNWGTIATWLQAIWEPIAPYFQAMFQSISDFVMSIWGTLTTWFTENQVLIQETISTVWNAISSIIQTVMTIIQPYLQSTWENIQLIISTVWEVIKTSVETAINLVLGIIKTVMQLITGDWSGAWETIKQTTSNVFNGIQTIVSTIISAISQYISNAWNGISGTFSNILNGIKNTASSIWNGIKDTISGAIDGARNAVSNGINAIKNLFNFQIKWPHIPLPHFRVSGSANPLDWLKGGLPSIGIDWYAKGGIMTKPTLFGMNGNRAMVGGEAGAEAILPLNKSTLGAIGQSIANTMNTSNNINVNFSGITIREEADINRLANVVGNRIAEELQRKTNLRGGIA